MTEQEVERLYKCIDNITKKVEELKAKPWYYRMLNESYDEILTMLKVAKGDK